MAINSGLCAKTALVVLRSSMRIILFFLKVHG